MKKELLVALAVSTAAIPAGTNFAAAQGAPQTIVQYKVDVTRVSNGYRSTKLVGANVVNETGDKIGTIDDLIITRDDRILYAIVSVGGFLGVGDKLVAVKYDSLHIQPDQILLPSATKETLKGLPTFTYLK